MYFTKLKHEGKIIAKTLSLESTMTSNGNDNGV
jgi:hypothetical protein